MIQKIRHYTIPYKGNDHKPHTVRHKTLVFFSALIILAKIITAGVLFFSFPTPAEFSTITSNRIVELTNKERIQNGLPELEMNPLLNQAAMFKAQHMLANDYFAHDAPDGTKPWEWFKQVEYEYTYAGENLAMNFSDAEDAVGAWMKSPTHKENIVSPNYQDIGVAVVVGELEGDNTTLVVQLFGKTYINSTGQNVFDSSGSRLANAKAAPTEVVVASERTEVRLEKPEKNWASQLTYYGKRLMFAVLAFVTLNLLLTIFIRIRVQHKPVIFHCLFVILLAGAMLLWDAHFVEGLGRVVGVY